MTFRPVPARWFELLVARSDLARAVEALAATGAIELEQRSETVTQARLPDFGARIEEYRHLFARYHPYWPAEPAPAPSAGLVGERLARALAQIHAWRQEADPVIQQLEALQAEQSDLALLAELLEHGAADEALLARLAASGAVLTGRLFVVPHDAPVPQMHPGLLYRELHTPARRFALAVGEPAALAILEQEFLGLKARPLTVPAWLAGVPDAGSRIAARQRELAQRIAAQRTHLAELARRYALAVALADLVRVDWFLAHVGRLPVSENFAWVTGWTDDVTGRALERALARANVRGVLRFPPPPPDKSPPVVLFNPRWVRPFELFARLLGTPGPNDADPSILLAVIAPLLFGYMFSDLGQGFVLFVAGLLLQRRLPALRLLVAGGLASMFFGVMFGSVFNLELLPPLWLHPLEHPLVVLVVPLAGGVGILLLGMVLNAFEALWRGQGFAWLRSDAALLVLYVSVLLLFADRAAAWLAGAALAWYLLGNVAFPRGPRLAAFGHAVQELLESAMQLGVNTLSFSRVGAFALAHAGLALAVVQMAESTGSAIGFVIVLVLGNLIVLVLEGLIVAIQTTRLILFEFFIRFFRGEGRVFRPLTAPLVTK